MTSYRVPTQISSDNGDYDGWGTEYGTVHVDTCTVPDADQTAGEVAR